MERILPVELENLTFRRAFGGYDRAGVDTATARCAKTIEELLNENQRLKQENEHLKFEMQAYRGQESTLRDTLVLAQKAAEESRSAAQKHADAMVEEGRQYAAVERMAMAQQLSEMRWDLERLKNERRNFRSEFLTLIERYQRELSAEPIVGVTATKEDQDFSEPPAFLT